jgi:hypothetical protein
LRRGGDLKSHGKARCPVHHLHGDWRQLRAHLAGGMLLSTNGMLA